MPKQGFAKGIPGDIYVYQEVTGLTSAAMGLDKTDSGKLKLHVMNGINALPDSSSQLMINPSTNIVSLLGLAVTTLSSGVVQTNSSGLFTSNNGANGQVIIGGGTAPAWANITSLGGTVAVTNGVNSINLEVSGSASASSFIEDSGSAVPVAGVINVLGGSNISTMGVGNTITVDFDGILPVSSGGTNAFSFSTTSGTIVYDGTRLVTTNTGTANFVLTSNGPATAPTYQNISASGAVTSVSGGNNITISGTSTSPVVNVSGTTNHSILLGNSSGSINSLINGVTGQLLRANTGADPSWSAVNLTADVSAILPIVNGGTNASTFATTDGTVYFDGTRLVTTATGTTNFVLTSGGPGVAPTYQTISASGAVTSINFGNNITITGTSTAPVINVSGTTNHSMQVGNSNGSLTSLAVGTNGQVLIGSTSSNPAFATLTSSGGTIIFTSGVNTLNLESSVGFTPAYVFAYDTASHTLTGSYLDMTFSNNGAISGWTHVAGSASFTCNVTGVYSIHYLSTIIESVSASYSGSVKVLLNNAEIAGSQTSVSLNLIAILGLIGIASSSTSNIINSFLVSLTAGDIIKVQAAGTNANIFGSGLGTVKPSMTLSINRIA